MRYNYFIHYNIDASRHQMEGNCVLDVNEPISNHAHILHIQDKIKEAIEPDIFIELGEEVDIKVLVDNFIQLPT